MMHSLLLGISLHNPVQLNLEVAATVLFYFAVYSFLGWLLENCYSFFRKKGFLKPNFFIGPFKPMYGFAPLILIFFTGYNLNIVMVFLLCLVIPTFVEYVSGYLLEKFFHRKWWDYSNHKWNVKGHICIGYSACWMFLSYFCISFIHPKIALIYDGVDQFWAWVWPTVGLYFLAELVLAARRHAQEAINGIRRTNIS